MIIATLGRHPLDVTPYGPALILQFGGGLTICCTIAWAKMDLSRHRTQCIPFPLSNKTLYMPEKVAIDTFFSILHLMSSHLRVFQASE